VGPQQQFGEVDEPTAATDLLVGLVQRDQFAAIRVALVVQVLGSETLVFLRIDEPLDLLGHPAAVVDLEVLEQALDQAQLVIRIDDLEILWQHGFPPVAAQHAMREAVKRADPEVLDRELEQALDALAHLRGRLVREGHGQQALW
jgi:hypothetical protein